MTTPVSSAVQEEKIQFCCGIDIGVKNLAISFAEWGATEGEPTVISYKGTMESIDRFSEGDETQTMTISGKRLSHHDSYITILESIPEFRYTVSTVIEMQLAMNKSDMSRLDGVAYGYLRGRYPTMTVSLNGSTIRKKFITDAITGTNVSEIFIPRSYPDTKHPSFLFIGSKYPGYYRFIRDCPGVDKLDDLCDSVVYASIAMRNHVVQLREAAAASRARGGK
jgi:hypothetical protein